MNRAGQIRGFVFPVTAAATPAGRWVPAVRWFAKDGRCVRTLILGGYGRSWDDAAEEAHSAARVSAHPVRHQ